MSFRYGKVEVAESEDFVKPKTTTRDEIRAKLLTIGNLLCAMAVLPDDKFAEVQDDHREIYGLESLAREYARILYQKTRSPAISAVLNPPDSEPQPGHRTRFWRVLGWSA